MKKYIVYLAGPITGLSYDGATDWREAVAKRLDSDRVETASPLRGKYHLKGSQSLKADGYSQPMSTNKGIMGRDHFDCCRADVLLVNVLGATKGSLGTAMEVAWAYDRHIPVVVVMETDGVIDIPGVLHTPITNPHHHAMFLEAATYVVPTLEEAERLIKVLLNEPGPHEIECKKPSHSMLIKALDTGKLASVGVPPPLPAYTYGLPPLPDYTYGLPPSPAERAKTAKALEGLQYPRELWRPGDDGEPK